MAGHRQNNNNQYHGSVREDGLVGVRRCVHRPLHTGDHIDMSPANLLPGAAAGVRTRGVAEFKII